MRCDRAIDDLAAALPAPQEGQDPAERVEVHERRRAEGERALRLGPGHLDLPREELCRGEDRPAPQARRLEVDALLREADGLLDRGVDRRHLEGVVEGVEPPELRPRQAERRVPRHGPTKGFDGRGELRGLAREYQVVGPQERAIRSQLVERTPLVLLRESAGDDSLLGRDARRDHLRDGFSELALGVGWIGLLVIVRPDLAAIGEVDEANADPQAALDLADTPTQREARAATRGPVRVAPPAAEDDVHVLVAAELGRQVLAQGSRRPRIPRGAVEGLDHDDGPVVQVARRLRVGRRRPDRPLGGRRPSQGRNVAAPGQLDPHGVVVAREQVVTLERAPQAHGLDANDRVEARVEVVPPPEHPPGDRDLAQLSRPAGHRLLDDVANEVPRPGRSVEVNAREEPLERRPCGVVGHSLDRREPSHVQDPAPLGSDGSRVIRSIQPSWGKAGGKGRKRPGGLPAATVSYAAATGPGPTPSLSWLPPGSPR